ncbi:MAG: 1-aminocyclopropane-1-carboxylate deaminase/D-cysteine desulfhydrase [Flavobacterium sp.]|nr:1-aminocyclopropane-1-carboxylate deaminase/D-cysteine desulfhydrase [Flavobacterium sp.]
MFNDIKSENQFLFSNKKISLYIKREDLIHPIISGNKFRKLKYNFLLAKSMEYKSVMTFGGAFSNHIAAVAYAGKEFGISTIGVIRGEELGSKVKENPTLKFAQECGMKFEFVSREVYKSKNEIEIFEHFKLKYGLFMTIPEGGTNEYGIKGCTEILTNDDLDFDYICTCVGSGGTISGLIKSSDNSQTILGFPALKADFLDNDIKSFVSTKTNWSLIKEYHFGGYGKVTNELVVFMNNFLEKYKILLDPIYTSKMVFGVMDLIDKNYFPDNSKILMIHTGGLQGIQGINNIRNKKNQILINTNV